MLQNCDCDSKMLPPPPLADAKWPQEMPLLLLVEDDQALATGLVQGLRRQGFEVELLTTGEHVVRRALSGEHALIVLDLMIPELSGFEILTQLQHRSSPPVIVLTARTELGDRLQRFSLGAVDYVCKPFWIAELVARIRTRLGLGASSPVVHRVLRFGGLAIDLCARAVTLLGEPVKLTRTEFDILAYLAARPGRASLDRIFAAGRNEDKHGRRIFPATVRRDAPFLERLEPSARREEPASVDCSRRRKSTAGVPKMERSDRLAWKRIGAEVAARRGQRGCSGGSASSGAGGQIPLIVTGIPSSTVVPDT